MSRDPIENHIGDAAEMIPANVNAAAEKLKHLGWLIHAAIVQSAADEIARLRDVLKRIGDMTDADNPESYRCDDREGCLDTVHGVARSSLQNISTPNSS